MTLPLSWEIVLCVVLAHLEHWGVLEFWCCCHNVFIYITVVRKFAFVAVLRSFRLRLPYVFSCRVSSDGVAAWCLTAKLYNFFETPFFISALLSPKCSFRRNVHIIKSFYPFFQFYPFPACRIIAFLKESFVQEYACVCCMSALAWRSVMPYLGYMKIFKIRTVKLQRAKNTKS